MSVFANQNFKHQHGRLPPLSREAEEAVELANKQVTSKSDIRTTSSPPPTHFTAKHKGLLLQPVATHGDSTNMQVALPAAKEVALPFSNRKPKFLENLEGFLSRELCSLGMEEVTANETRLQAHREVFEYLIEDFKTYKPIFAAIKNEYEMMLRHQQEYIKQLQPLQQMLVTVTEQCDNEIMRLRDKEKTDIAELKKQNGRLQSVIDNIRNEQIALQTQVERLQQKLSEQYDKYRSEADARKLLVSDINDLRAQQEELILQQKQASNRDESEDPVLIRLALKKSRESEKEASHQLNYIIANYGDVIPKNDYLTLKSEYQILQEKVSARAAEFDQLKEEQDSLLETHRQVIRQRDEYYQESERLRQTATPRPDWNKCGAVIPGGVLRWNDLSQGKSSNEMVGILLNELAQSTNDSRGDDFFDSLGTTDDVPLYLRKAEGSVKNRRLGRRDAMLLIKDIWREKDLSDSTQASGKREPMAQFLLKYLESKFPDAPEMVMEWTYNLDSACVRYGVHDSKIQYFYDVLNDRVDQELYFDQLQSIVSLLKLLTKENEKHEPEGFFTVEEFSKILSQYLENKVTSEEIEGLMTAAQLELNDTDQSDEGIEFTRLFFEDDEGKFGPFVDELKRLLSETRKKYTTAIVEILRATELEGLTAEDLSTAMTTVDPNLDPASKEATIAWVYREKSAAELEVPNSITIDELEDRINRILIKKFF